jgi:hypothetical protein
VVLWRLRPDPVREAFFQAPDPFRHPALVSQKDGGVYILGSFGRELVAEDKIVDASSGGKLAL